MRNNLIGVRFTPEEHALLEQLLEHFRQVHPGMRFNKQMIIRAGVFNYAKSLGIVQPKVSPGVKAKSSRTR